MIDIEKLKSFLIEEYIDLDKLARESKKLSFMEILGVENRELQHSNFLRWIFDPMGSHHMGDFFLRTFLNSISFSDEHKIRLNLADLTKSIILREKENIDILIINEELKFCICIENKVWAPLAEHQLGKYHEIIDSYEFSLKLYIFLTPFPRNVNPEFEYIYENKTYFDLYRLLEFTLNNNTIEDQCKFMIEDYMNNLNRNILGESESIKLAQSIYFRHKDAIDFIWNNRPDFISIKNQVSEFISKRRSDKYVNYTLDKDKYFVRFLPRKVVDKFRYDFNSWDKSTDVMFVIELIFTDNKIWIKFCFGAIYNEKKIEEYQKIKSDIFNKMRALESLQSIKTSNKTKSTSQYPSVANRDLITNKSDIISKFPSLMDAFEAKFIEFESQILDRWTEEIIKNF
ncbi:MAG: PD-(D/E)XK nuclease family protein [Spirosomaceae bacterium]|jgi:nuclear transport factor 2 (NTF2) superfamily protein|nr:PD-(D/E)XK nuclease family protein [Spirosomataceae bacterium]